MILSRRVSFCGEQLDELDDSIVIRHADPGVPNESIQAVERMGGWGQRVTGQHWNTLEASVAFAINIKKTEMTEQKQAKIVADKQNEVQNKQTELTAPWALDLCGSPLLEGDSAFP